MLIPLISYNFLLFVINITSWCSWHKEKLQFDQRNVIHNDKHIFTCFFTCPPHMQFISHLSELFPTTHALHNSAHHKLKTGQLFWQSISVLWWNLPEFLQQQISLASCGQYGVEEAESIIPSEKLKFGAVNSVLLQTKIILVVPTNIKMAQEVFLLKRIQVRHSTKRVIKCG